MHEFIHFTLIVVQFISNIAGKNPKTYHNEKSRFNFLSWQKNLVRNVRSGPPEVIVEKDILKICSKCAGEHPCQSVIPVKCFIRITLQNGCSPANCLHIFITSFLKNSPGELLWNVLQTICSEKFCKITGSGLSFLTEI